MKNAQIRASCFVHFATLCPRPPLPGHDTPGPAVTRPPATPPGARAAPRGAFCGPVAGFHPRPPSRYTPAPARVPSCPVSARSAGRPDLARVLRGTAPAVTPSLARFKGPPRVFCFGGYLYIPPPGKSAPRQNSNESRQIFVNGLIVQILPAFIANQALLLTKKLRKSALFSVAHFMVGDRLRISGGFGGKVGCINVLIQVYSQNIFLIPYKIVGIKHV